MAKPGWLSECIASIADAIDQSPFPVELHIVNGTKGHIGKGRAEGYAQGCHPYVTFVDDDDFLLPGAFAQMAEAIKFNPEAVCSPEWLLYGHKRILGRSRHHLTALRRDQLIDHRQWPSCGDVAQAARIGNNAIELPEAMYVHRIYPESPARVLRRSYPQELERASYG